jgi:hypothetical protein
VAYIDNAQDTGFQAARDLGQLAIAVVMFSVGLETLSTGKARMPNWPRLKILST